MQLETWFDGEAPEGLAWHLAACAACFRHVDRLSRVRTAVRQDFAPASLRETESVPGAALGGVGLGGNGPSGPLRTPAARDASSVPTGPQRLRSLVVVPVILLLVAGAIVGVGESRVHGTLSASRGPGTPNAAGAGVTGEQAAGTGTGADQSSGGPGPGSAGSATGTASGRGGSSAGVADGRLPGALGALSLGVVVPTQGTGAADGTEIAQAVRQAVKEANAAGGVGGAPVQLTLVAAEDPSAVAALAGHVSAMVGGFGAAAPVGTSWILPADPWASGPQVVAAELSPRDAGARLGSDLVSRGQSGTVGVIQGDGPDAALAAGLAEKVPITTVQAPSSGTCVPAVTQLEQRGVVAVAVAGSPSVATSCVSALGALSWQPPGGVLLAPSAAYSGAASPGLAPPGTDVYTVLGLPWPESSSPGAERFRAALPGVTSYRALVSYAAVELAVDVARATGNATVASVAGGTWHNDLFDFDGTTNAGAQVVQESSGGWVAAP
ncbi:MAG: ABC transporter substrate-binding protein [Acidimicrobiales bacterium]